jgi:predicted transcriptional regulator
MAKKKLSRIPKQFRLSPDVVRELEAKAEQLNQTQSLVVEMALKRALKQLKVG